MTLRDIINKEFEVITEETRKEKKVVKIFYKLNLNLIKPAQTSEQPEQPEQQDNEVNNQQPEQQQQNNMQAPQQDLQQQNTQMQNNVPQPENNIPQIDVSELPSIQTEETENNNVDIKDDNTIVRKLEGEVELKKEKVDEIQTFQDIIEYLTKEQVEGVSVLDDFSSEILNIIFTPQASQISQKVDKKSSIFADIQYGFGKDDNVGVRIKKTANSDLISNVMIIDGSIINAPFNLMKVNERIIDYRNSLINKQE